MAIRFTAGANNVLRLRMYPFNWIDFRWRLLPVIENAMRVGPPYSSLRQYYQENFDELRQPETGGPVAAGWNAGQERSWNIQELIDVVLTDYYDPSHGLDGSISAKVCVESAGAGVTIEADGVRFDPTGDGSLFWTDEELRERRINRLANLVSGIRGAAEMLEYCGRAQLGAYLRIGSRRIID